MEATFSRSGRSGRRIAAGLLLGALSAGLVGGMGIRQARAQVPQLPDGAGRFLVLEACVQCHDLSPIVTQRKSAEGWRRSVNEMVWRGAQLMGDEADVITRYLTASFGLDSPIGDTLQTERRAAEVEAQRLPPGEGRTLVLSACVQCHGLEPIVTSRRSAADWRRSIAQMIQLGVSLMGDEIELLTRYLTDAFGPDTPIPDPN